MLCSVSGQGAIGKIIITHLAQVYITNNGGFSYCPAGQCQYLDAAH